MVDRIRTLVVDDHHVVRQGLVALLRVMPEIEVVGERERRAPGHRTPPHVCIRISPSWTCKLPNLGGVAAITRIRAETPAARFIVLTTFDGDEDIFRSLQAGAKAYLLKGIDHR